MNWLRENALYLLTGLLTGAGCLAACLFLAALLAFWLFGPRLFPAPSTTPPTPIPAPVSPTPPHLHTPTPPHLHTPTPPHLTTPQSTPPTGHIVFTCFNASYDDICRIDAGGGDLRRLTSAPATDFYPEISPLGDLITFSSRRSGEFRIYTMDIDGNDITQVGPDSGSHFAPDISPDGTQIIFTNALADQAGRRQHIWIMNIDGSNPRPLTSGPYNDVDPAWSPDGTRIAFSSDRGWRPAHWIMDADGENMIMLPDDIPEHGGRSDWSPDGQWLAFYAGPRDLRDIYLVATDGSGQTRRLTGSGRNLAPAFSPDGQWIVFTSYREGDNANLFIMRPDGTDVRQLTSNPRPDWQPRWGP